MSFEIIILVLVKGLGHGVTLVTVEKIYSIKYLKISWNIKDCPSSCSLDSEIDIIKWFCIWFVFKFDA